MCRAATEERGQLDASPTLFTVMAAMDAAGIGPDPGSPSNHPLRAAVRAELAKRNIPSLPEIKKFFTIHRQKNDTVELSQYVSFALTAGGPPDFEIKGRDVDIAPDVTPIGDLSSLLAAFYKEGNLADLWKRSQPAIEQYLERYHQPVADAVLQVNSYLRQQTSGFKGRQFQVFVELLAPPNQIQTRSYGNFYTIVLTPSTEPKISDVRHAYLHYLLDPLATRYQEVLMRKRGLVDHAQRAQALAENYKSDFLLLATECLIKAVEARLDHKPEQVTQALQDGYILAPYFAESLPAYEKQEQAMLFYFEAMAGAIELKKEDARLAKVEFNKEARVRTVKTAPAPPPPPLTGAAKTLEEAEQFYKSRDLDKAKQQYLNVLQQTEDMSMHAQAYYGLARIAVLQKDPEVAERLFQKTLDSKPDAQVKAWSLVYLGRLADAAGDREQAVKHFHSALGVEGASTAARQAAEQGVQQDSSK
jgi:predicted negative regulator of RcsB-dependent stress response